MIAQTMMLASLLAAAEINRGGEWQLQYEKIPGNLVREDFVSDNWGGLVGWDISNPTRIQSGIQRLDELSPNGKPVIRLTSEEVFDNTGRDGMHFRCDGKIGLKNGEPCKFSAYVRTHNLPKFAMQGLMLHGTPWNCDVKVPIPRDTNGKWVKLEWSGKLNLSDRYSGLCQYAVYIGGALGQDAYIDLAEPYLSGTVDSAKPGDDLWKAKTRAGRLTPVDPLLDNLNAEHATMKFYYPGDLKNYLEPLELRATVQGRTVTAKFDDRHFATADFGPLPPTQCVLKAELVGVKTGAAYLTNTYRVRVRKQIANATPLKRLNNYVCEIFTRPLANGTNTFVLAKPTWVYFGFSKPVPGATAAVDGEPGVVIFRADEHQEGMRFLEVGAHTVVVDKVPQGTEGTFSVRTVKPILRCGLNLSSERYPNFDEYRYGEAFWRRLGLFHGFNMAGFAAKRGLNPAFQPLLAELRDRGVEVQYGYGMGGWDKRRCDYDTYLNVVTNNVAYQRGFTMAYDESSIITGVGKWAKINTTEIWWKAFDDGHHINTFFDDGGYAIYVHPTYDLPELSAYVNQGDGKGLIFTEAYFRGVSSSAQMNQLLDFLRVQIRSIRKLMPMAVTRYSYLLSGWTMHGAWSPWWCTELDMRAMLGEVCRMLATDPEFKDNGGITFSTPACWEDFWRCISAGLVRHYCIEGRTDDFAKTQGMKLFPGHLQNGDFLNEFEHWQVEPAEPGSIGLGEKRDFGSNWQGRQYPSTYKAHCRRGHQKIAGDHFATLKRSAKGPNRIRQTIANLEPGRVYQVVSCASDREVVEKSFDLGNTCNADCKRRRGTSPIVLAMKVNGAEVIDDLCHSTTNFAKYGRGMTRTTRIVFRATKPTAEVEFSDWKNDREPGDKIGGVTYLNNINAYSYYYSDERELDTLKDLYRAIHAEEPENVRVRAQPAALPRSADFIVHADRLPVDVLESPELPNRPKQVRSESFGYATFEAKTKVTVEVELVSESVEFAADARVLPAEAGVKVERLDARHARFTLPGPGHYLFKAKESSPTLLLEVRDRPRHRSALSPHQMPCRR